MITGSYEIKERINKKPAQENKGKTKRNKKAG